MYNMNEEVKNLVAFFFLVAIFFLSLAIILEVF